MKYLFIFLTFQLFSFSSWAVKIRSQIHSLEPGTKKEPHLVKMKSGEVGFIDFRKKSLFKKIQNLQKSNEWIELNLDDRHNVRSFEVIPPETEERLNDFNDPVVQDPFVPSIVSSETAAKVFKRMRRNYQKDSQCYNRAHVWAYEEYLKSKINSNKVFLFFTSRYIRKYRYHWWFHVTPMVYVGGSKVSNWRMLDRRYAKNPLYQRTWTNFFIRSKKACKIVSNFSDYQNNQLTQDCYLIRASMYYVVPSDLSRLEQSGTQRTEFDQIEIGHARWEAF